MHRIVLFLNFLNMFSVTAKTDIKIQHFRVTFYLLRVQYPWYHCSLWISAAIEKIAALFIFRTTGPCMVSRQNNWFVNMRGMKK